MNNDSKCWYTNKIFVLFVVPYTIMFKVTYRPKGSGVLVIVFMFHCIRKTHVPILNNVLTYLLIQRMSNN